MIPPIPVLSLKKISRLAKTYPSYGNDATFLDSSCSSMPDPMQQKNHQ